MKIFSWTSLLTASLLSIALLASTPGSAQAYMDPGSGSLIIQVIIAAVLGLGVTLKLYWQRLMGLFGRGRRSEDSDFDD